MGHTLDGRRDSRAFVLALAVTVFLAHASVFAAWLVDDAGISLAYAANLAQGHGLRSQPGAPAVEGFSNPLWTALLCPLTLLPPDAAPSAIKLLSLLLVIASFGLVFWFGGSGPGPAWALLLLALSPSFVIWTTSGLENPLFAFLGVASILITERSAAGRASLGVAATAGLIAAGLALTRPDGLAYAPLFAIGLLMHARASGEWRVALRAAILQGAVLAAVFGGYLAFRWFYFEDFVPNTYRAKFLSTLADHDPGRLAELARAVAGPVAVPLVAALVAASLLLVRRRRLSTRALVLWAHLAAAALVYVVLPPDWMGEHRFATLFVVCFWWLVFEVGGCFVAQPRSPELARRFSPVGAGVLLALACSAGSTVERSLAFAENPIVPLARIREFGRGYESLARHVEAPSLLAPDLGGVLLEAKRLRVHDLAGLCDKEIARTLMRDARAFHDYVFERLRPTFIHAHSTWADWASLHSDPRFERDYLPLHEVWQRPGQPLISGEDHAEPQSGDYVRKSAVPVSGGIAALRAEFRRLGLDQPLP